MSPMDRRRVLVALGLAAPLAAAWPAWADAGDPALEAAIASDLRPAADKARDVYRHPEASLLFWGLKPGMTVLDISPGAGWWTDILAPYLARTGGRYIAAVADLNDPATGEGARRGRAAFEAKYVGKPQVYGDVSTVGFGRHSGPLAPAGTVDLVLVSREIHDWAMVDGFTEKAFNDFHAALKGHGIMAVEDHRAPEGADPKKGDGYISEKWVITEAQGCGFELAAKSEINANPRDTKNYPFGVWTLPPTRRSAPAGQPPNPAFDHARYDAIGESDRMTLKFVRT